MLIHACFVEYNSFYVTCQIQINIIIVVDSKYSLSVPFKALILGWWNYAWLAIWYIWKAKAHLEHSNIVRVFKKPLVVVHWPYDLSTLYIHLGIILFSLVKTYILVIGHVIEALKSF